MHSLILITALSATTGLCGGHKRAHCAPAPTCAPAPVYAPAPVEYAPAPMPVCEPAPACEPNKKKCGLLGGLFKKKHHGCAPAPVACEPAPVACEPAPVACEPAPVACEPAPVYHHAAPVYYAPAPAPSPQSMPTPQAPGKMGYNSY